MGVFHKEGADGDPSKRRYSHFTAWFSRLEATWNVQKLGTHEEELSNILTDYYPHSKSCYSITMSEKKLDGTEDLPDYIMI